MTSAFSDNLKVLFVSYAFPPVGGAGVARTAKLVKYIGDFGINASVLTAQNASVPLRDETLTKEVPETVTVYRCRTFEPDYSVKGKVWQETAAGNGEGKASLIGRAKKAVVGVAKQLLVPDAQVLWVPSALRKLREILRKEPDMKVVWISGPPFSQFLLGELAASMGRKVVFDYRDEWDTYRNAYEMMGSLSRRVGERMEKRLVGKAHHFTFATESFRQHFLKRFPAVRPEQTTTWTNGYDETDFPAEFSEPNGDRLTLCYAGTVFRLTTAKPLFDALKLLEEQTPELAQSLRLRFIGRVVETEKKYFDSLQFVQVDMEDYLPKGEVLNALASSDVTLCLLADVPGTERIFPGKIFELLHLPREVLVIAPPGELTALAEKKGGASVFAPSETHKVADMLADRLVQFRTGDWSPHQTREKVEEFSRRRLAQSMAELLLTLN